MTDSDLPVLIIHTGDPDETLKAAYGSYAALMQSAADLPDNAVHIVPVFLGEQPEAPQNYRAALITGSPAMVTDREPWSEQTAHWLRQAALDELPMFGVCYGHQLLAHALGGQVDYNPAGREIGTHVVERIGDDPLMADLPRRFFAQMMHAQSVVQPPPGATVLGRSALDGCQAMRMGRNIISTQFHPEFSPAFMRAHLQRYGERYAREHLDAAALARELRGTPEATGLLSRFLRMYAESAPMAQ
jgi:GMP synthase (glutamine-hydrolysing)